MNVLILTVGSRGDIQPFVALGVGLQKAGYNIRLAAPAVFESFVRQRGLDFAPINDDILKLKDTSGGKAALEGKRGEGLALIKQVMPMVRRMLDDEWTAAVGANWRTDAIIYHPKSMGGFHIGEKLGVPTIMSLPLPLYSPTSAFPMPIMPPWKLGGWYNRATYGIVPMLAAPYMGVINKWRKSIGLQPVGRFLNELKRWDGTPMPILYSYSPHVAPQPSDWNGVTYATGYWILPENHDWQPSKELAEFLQKGEAPVYVGFGSMAGQNAEAKARMIVEGLQMSRQRGIIASGWGGLETSDLPDNILAIEEAPHEWLFPHVSAVVHHGGAGTTAAGLRAGKPTVICPFIADQPFWGRRIAELGVGVDPIPQKQLTAEKLADAIRTVTGDAEMRRRAEALGEKLRAEDGVGNAVKLVQKYVGAPKSVKVMS
jgi:sterol 3beta-glucosyltransferase